MPKVNFERRGVIRTGAIGALAIVASLVGRTLNQASAATTSSKTTSKNAKGQIIKLASLPVGGTFNFTHSTQGVPAILFRTKVGVFAYSAICTHQGCTVGYDKGSKKLVCPCHGATYDPSNGAKVLNGPTNTPLAKVKVKVSGAWVVEA